jgi:hypothetical protein
VVRISLGVSVGKPSARNLRVRGNVVIGSNHGWQIGNPYDLVVGKAKSHISGMEA